MFDNHSFNPRTLSLIHIFPLEKDDTQYRLITSNYVSVGEFEGHPMLKVEPEGLRLLAAEAFHDVAFFLRPAHLKQVAAILDDPEASANDKSVALTMLRNAEVAAAGILPFCQDTGTATIVGKKGQQVWTGCDDCEFLSHGVYAVSYTHLDVYKRQSFPFTLDSRRKAE